MGQSDALHRRSIGGAIFLIALGLLFLFFNLRPEADPWPVVSHFWPLILIFLGLGKLWDYLWRRGHPGAGGPRVSGASVALILLLILFGVATLRGRHSNFPLHDAKALERQGAQSLRADLEMPAGELRLSGGSSRLLDADFRYAENQGTPRVDYSVANGAGDLRIRQEGRNVRWGPTENDWDLRLSNELPLDLRLQMGAGYGELRLRDIPLTRLSVNMGAGKLRVDLTGERKSDVQAAIHGGVGQAVIRLPKNVGVLVHASGGIGSIEAGGLKRENGAYVNDAYGKSPATIKLTVEGGIGQISLELEP